MSSQSLTVKQLTASGGNLDTLALRFEQFEEVLRQAAALIPAGDATPFHPIAQAANIARGVLKNIENLWPNGDFTLLDVGQLTKLYFGLNQAVHYSSHQGNHDLTVALQSNMAHVAGMFQQQGLDIPDTARGYSTRIAAVAAPSPASAAGFKDFQSRLLTPSPAAAQNYRWN